MTALTIPEPIASGTLGRYLDEQCFRYDQRADDNAGQFHTVMRTTKGRRLTFAAQTNKNSA